MTDLYLYVDNEDSSGAWNTAGSPPYLGAQDQPTNYIYSTSRNTVSGVYSFEGTAETGTINSVTLYIYAYGVATNDFEAYLGASATGLGPPAGSWQLVSTDVSAILTSWAQINAATVSFDRPNTTNDAGVDECYLLIDYVAGVADRNVSETDDVTIGDSETVTPLVLADVVETDGLALGESYALALVVATSITDGLTLADSPSVDPLAIALNITDGLTLGETTLASLPDALAMGISDGLTVADVPKVEYPVEAYAIDLGVDNLSVWQQGVVVYD